MGIVKPPVGSYADKIAASGHALHFIVPAHDREDLREPQSNRIGQGSAPTLLKGYGRHFQQIIGE